MLGICWYAWQLFPYLILKNVTDTSDYSNYLPFDAAAAASLCVQVKGAIPSMPDRKSVLDLLHSQVTDLRH